MKRSIFNQSVLLTVLLAAGPLLFAQDALPEPDVPEAVSPAVPAWQMKFENLPPEIRSDYFALINQSSQLFNQKRIFEALNKALDAEKIFDESPGALNLKGACYVEFRDFAKARQFFEEALTLAPESPNVIFNLVEMDFVMREWKQCETRTTMLLGMLRELIEQNLSDNDPNNDEQYEGMSRLVEFKMLLAKIKLGKIDEARQLADKYDYLDDYPYYYYAQATMAYHDQRLSDAERWLGSARRIFRDPKILAPWQDTLIEFGYIKSFYGTNLDEESGDTP